MWFVSSALFPLLMSAFEAHFDSAFGGRNGRSQMEFISLFTVCFVVWEKVFGSECADILSAGTDAPFRAVYLSHSK